MVTALYASLLACIMIFLSVQVIKQRRANKIAYADGEVESLKIARSAQSNATEYIPITLIMMALFEYNSGPLLLIHSLGVIFILGRILHAKAILSNTFPGRKAGMMMTFGVMLALIVLNLVYLPFDKMW
ncbi:MAPEG family protein [uncultured Vibrio sp.]|uniref:MAPEG family protein n=1 Tax=uncultured Vibrio sp. TaxID=114054 RepID=UPI0025FC2E2B|nr:MAPEG family protein [uncultured Vibrio sp.]